MTHTKSELEALIALAENATPWPDEVRVDSCRVCRDEGKEGEFYIPELAGGNHAMFALREDAEFVARARTALPQIAKQLMDAMEAIQIASETFCSFICPSTGTVGIQIPHDPRCTAMRESLAAYHKEKP